MNYELKNKYDGNNVLNVQNSEQSYKKELREETLFRFLLEGKIPSREEFLLAAKEIEETNGNGIAENISRNLKSDIKPRAKIYTDTYVKLLGSMGLDINAMRNLIVSRYYKMLEQTEKWETFSSERFKELRSLESLLDNQLFTTSLSSGFLFSAAGNFLGEKVNTSTENSVKVLTLASADSRSSLIDPRTLRYTYGLAPSNRFSAISESPGTSINNLKQESGNHIVLLEDITGGRKGLVYKVTLDSERNISSLRLKIGVMSSSGSIRVSGEKISGEIVQVQEQALEPEMLFILNGQKLSSINVEVYLDTHTELTRNSRYRYLFNMRQISLYEGVQQYVNSGTYISEEIESTAYTKAAVSVCSVKGPETEVKAYLSNDRVNWVQVRSSNEEPGAPGYIATFNNIRLNNETSETTEKIVEEKEKGKLLKVSEQELYLSPLDSVSIVNSVLPLNIIPRSIDVYEDYRESGSLGNGGWIVNPEFVETNVKVETGTAQVINFGPTPVLINGVSVTGLFTMESGKSYNIRAPRFTYTSIAQGVGNEEILSTLDPLYPFNVKYLIEGYDYPAGFLGEKVYRKVGNRYRKRLSRELVISNLREGKFSTFLTRDGSGYIILVNKENSEAFENGKWLIEYQVEDQTWDKIYVKLELSTRVPELSPIVTSFLVKTGL